MVKHRDIIDLTLDDDLTENDEWDFGRKRVRLSPRDEEEREDWAPPFPILPSLMSDVINVPETPVREEEEEDQDCDLWFTSQDFESDSEEAEERLEFAQRQTHSQLDRLLELHYQSLTQDDLSDTQVIEDCIQETPLRTND